MNLKGGLFGILLILIGLNYGCKKEIGEFLLGDLKNQNPFTGYETLIFLNDQNDSIVFNGAGRYSELFHYEPDTEYDRGKYYVNERDICRFVEQNDKYEILIDLSTHALGAKEMDIFFLYSTT